MRNNEDRAIFYTEYFKFEIALLHKMIERRNILNGEAKKEQLDFVMDAEDQAGNEKDEELPMQDTNILQIVLNTIIKKFGGKNLRVFSSLWKSITKGSFLKDFDPTFYKSVKSAYVSQRVESSPMYLQYVEIKLERMPQSERVMGKVEKLIDNIKGRDL